MDKYNRVDLLAVDANETILVIEIQYAWQPSYLKRLLYSTAKLVVEHIKLGQSYDNVRKVISISIVYFPFTPQDGDYLYHGKTNFFGLNNGKQLQVNMAKLPKPTAIASNATEDDSDVNIFPEYYQLGRTEEKRENAYKMRQEGLALNLIAKITGLTEAEIAGLNSVHESNHFVNGQNLKTE